MPKIDPYNSLGNSLDIKAKKEIGINIPRIFIGGFEITPFIRSTNINISRDDIASVKLEIVAFPISFEDGCIFIGELPNDEFMAEMVRIKLKREGVMDKKKGE